MSPVESPRCSKHACQPSARIEGHLERTLAWCKIPLGGCDICTSETVLPHKSITIHQRLNHASLTIIEKFRLAQAVPLGGSINYFEIGAKTGLDPDLVERLIQHSIGQRIFQQPAPD